jgi:hypothetical protein
MAAPFDRAAMQALAGSPWLARLSALRVGGVPSAAIAPLAASPHLGGLASLTFDGAADDTTARASASSPHLARLRTLRFLRCGELGHEGASAFARVASLPALEELSFDGTPIGAEGATAIAHAPILGRLARLRAVMSRLGPAGARALAGSPHLARLELAISAADVHAAGLKALARSALAGLTIHDSTTVDGGAELWRGFGGKIRVV